MVTMMMLSVVYISILYSLYNIDTYFKNMELINSISISRFLISI